MPPKTSSETSSEIETGTNIIGGIGVASIALGLTIAKTQGTITQVMPLEDMAGEQMMGLGGVAVLFALLAKYHYGHRYPQ